MVVDEYPLSSLQQGMLFHALSAPHGGVDIEQITIDYREPVRLDLLERAWQCEVDRHPVLRSSFHWGDVPEPVQRVHSGVPVHIERRPAADDASFAAFLAADRSRGFDLNAAPLTRLALFEMAPDHYRLVWTLHHILMDGRAFVIVLSEVEEQYGRFLRGEVVLAGQGPEYRPYVEWQRAKELGGASAFWRAKLEGLEGPTPLPPDLARDRSDDTELVQAELPEAYTSALARLAKENNITLNTIVMGAWGILLARHTGTSRVLFGAVKTARAGTVAGASSVVGLFLNVLPVQMDFDGDPLVIEALTRLRTEWLSLREYDFVPLSLPRHAASLDALNSLFDTIVVFENERFDQMLSASSPSWRTRDVRLFERTGYALTFKAFAGANLLLQLEFDHQQFSRETAQLLLGRVRQLLMSISDEPHATVGNVRILTEPEVDLVVRGWNRTDSPYPRDVSLAALLERQVAESPDAVAVVYGQEAVTYRELNARANRLANRLRDEGAGPDVLVGLCVERSIAMVVALLGIVKSGAAYLPLDPLLPVDRLRYMIEDSGVRFVVTQRRLRGGLPEFVGAVVMIDEEPGHTSLDDAPQVAVTPEHLAYVIYTSGSTGRPKGVQVARGALTNLLWSMRDWFRLRETDRVLALTTISFDIAGLELWLPLLVGAQIIVASREAAADAGRLRALVERHDVTFLQATPVTWRLLLDSDWQGKAHLQAVCTGEAMPRDLAATLAPLVGRLWNLYGPTETTIWSTGCVVESGQGPIVVGRPLPNTQCYILDSNRQPVPVGVVGELYIGGDGVARGYLNRPELTAEKFLPDPFRNPPRSRMYQTGDLARYRPNGDIECLGRTDHQVKIRGFRIELGEIEAALEQHSGVKQAVVVAREDRLGDRRLVGYIVPTGDPEPTHSELRAVLRQQLPDYMVPSAFATLAELPVSSNGKIDRNALPPPDGANTEDERAYVGPRTPVEEQLAGVWSELLQLDRIGVTDNLFDLGADSLIVMRSVAAVREVFDVDLPVGRFVATPTIEGLACAVTELGALQQLPADELERLLQDLEQDS